MCDQAPGTAGEAAALATMIKRSLTLVDATTTLGT